jgi:hypothetical protein
MWHVFSVVMDGSPPSEAIPLAHEFTGFKTNYWSEAWDRISTLTEPLCLTGMYCVMRGQLDLPYNYTTILFRYPKEFRQSFPNLDPLLVGYFFCSAYEYNRWDHCVGCLPEGEYT